MPEYFISQTAQRPIWGNILIIIILNICDRGRLKGCLCWTGGATENGVGSYPQLHCTTLHYTVQLHYVTTLLWYTGSKATDEKATSSLFVSCLLVGEKVAFLSAQKATMKIFIFGHATGWICLKMLF